MKMTANIDRHYFGRTVEYDYNSTYPKGGVSCSKDSCVVNGSLVFQIKFCGKSPALLVAANRVCLESIRKSGKNAVQMMEAL